MTEQRPVEFWIAELDRHTASLLDRSRVKTITEHRLPGGGKRITEETEDPRERLQRAANTGRSIIIHLNAQQRGMSAAQRRAFYTAALRHGQALLPLAGEDKPAVSAMIASARSGLDR